MAFRTFAEESRPAMPLASAGKLGTSASPHTRAPPRPRPPLPPRGASGKLGVFLPVTGEPRVPIGAKPAAARTDSGGEMSADAIRHQKLCIFRPAVEALGQANLLHAERLAMRGAGVMLVRRPLA